MDGGPSWENKAAFLNLSSVAWTIPKLLRQHKTDAIGVFVSKIST